MEWTMVFWVVLIVAVPTALWFQPAERKEPTGSLWDPPQSVLTRRYLSGEIDRKEFLRALARPRGKDRRKDR